jgi:hypothetical protein
MKMARVCLTLLANREIRDELIEHLSEQPELVPGFTASDAEGHGPTVRLRTAAERVKGRADRALVKIIMDEAAATQLITQIEQEFVGSHLVYWTTPVLSFGVIT